MLNTTILIIFVSFFHLNPDWTQLKSQKDCVFPFNMTQDFSEKWKNDINGCKEDRIVLLSKNFPPREHYLLKGIEKECITEYFGRPERNIAPNSNKDVITYHIINEKCGPVGDFSMEIYFENDTVTSHFFIVE